MVETKQAGLLRAGLSLIIDSVDFGLHLGDVIVADGRYVRFPRELDQVGGLVDTRFSQGFGACLCRHEVVGLPAGGTPQVAVAAVVASDDGLHFPPAQPVIKILDADSYLAHEQREELVDGR